MDPERALVQSRRAPLFVALAAVALAFSWQALTVHCNYNANWTALFCAGSRTPVPPELASENLFIFPNSRGYDGQFYHLVAHDPLLQRGFQLYLDSAVLRSRRILVPGLAFLLVAGKHGYVHAGYFVVLLGSVFLGASCLSRYAVAHGWHPLCGLGFLLLPSVIISLDRATVGVTLAALVAAFVLYADKGPAWKVYLVCVLALLARETGILLLGGYVLFLLWKRKWMRTIVFATAVLPALGWYIFVESRTAGDAIGVSTKTLWGPYPGEAFLHFMLRPRPYPDLAPELAWTALALDYLAMFGVLLAVVLITRVVTRASGRKTVGPAELAGTLYAIMAMFLGTVIGWQEPFGYTRTLSPLFLLLGMHALSTGLWWAALPLAMVVPRIVLQLGPQVLGILHRVF